MAGAAPSIPRGRPAPDEPRGLEADLRGLSTGRPPSSTRSASIYAAIGGAPAVSAAVDDLYRRVLGDPALAGYFAGVDVDRVKVHQRLFVAAALGGPGGYRGRPMREAHAALHVRDDDFDRVVEHLVATLTALGVDHPTIAAIGDVLGPLREQIVEEPARAAGRTA